MKKKIILFLGLLLMLVISCGGKHPAEKDFENTMKAYQSGDLTKMPQNSNSTTAAPEITNALGEAYKKITYKINKTTVNKNEAIINVTMRTPDLSNVMNEVVTKMMQEPNLQVMQDSKLQTTGSSKIMADLIKEKLSDSNNLKYNEKTFDVIYKKTGDKWYPDPYTNREYIQMITFGMFNVQ